MQKMKTQIKRLSGAAKLRRIGAHEIDVAFQIVVRQLYLNIGIGCTSIRPCPTFSMA